MQLAEFGLIAALQLCVARHAHLHVHAHMPRHQQAPAVSTRTTTSLLFVEVDLGVQYQKVYTTTKAALGMETALGNPRAGFQPSIVGLHHQPQALSSEGWTETNDVNSTWRVGHYSSVRHPTFHAIATPMIHGSLSPLSPTGTGRAPGNLHTFTSSGSHGKQGASRSAVVIMTLILAAASVISLWWWQ